MLAHNALAFWSQPSPLQLRIFAAGLSGCRSRWASQARTRLNHSWLHQPFLFKTCLMSRCLRLTKARGVSPGLRRYLAEMLRTSSAKRRPPRPLVLWRPAAEPEHGNRRGCSSQKYRTSVKRELASLFATAVSEEAAPQSGTRGAPAVSYAGVVGDPMAKHTHRWFYRPSLIKLGGLCRATWQQTF